MNEHGLKVGDILWRMRGHKKNREDETEWHAIPLCIEHVDEHKFLDAYKCGGSWNMIGRTYFLSREEALKDWEEHRQEYAQPAVTSAILHKENRLGTIMNDNTSFWRNEDLFRVLVDHGLYSVVPVSMNDIPWKIDENAGEYGMPVEYTTLGMIREKLGTGHVITVWFEGPMHGEIYQTGNYPGETAWRLKGKVMGYA